MLEIMLDNKNGNVWSLTGNADYPGIASDLKINTNNAGNPTNIDLNIIKRGIFQESDFNIKIGDIITITKDSANLFKGYVFGINRDDREKVNIKAYDQIRYLMNNDTFVEKGKTASYIISKIAASYNLQAGTIEDTKYIIPTLVEDGKKPVDVIQKCLSLTLINTGNNFVFYDDFGKLMLRNTQSMVIDSIIGDYSLMTGFQYNTSIDSDTYNYIKLYQDNKNTGKREVYIGFDSNNVAQWGRLQLYQSVDEKLNAAQIKETIDKLIALKNREKKSIKIDAIGDVNFRAGFYVPIFIEEYGINQFFAIESCSHSFKGSEHTMQLQLRVI